MEFKFRSVDERPPPSSTRSSAYLSLQHQHHHHHHHQQHALRGGVAPPPFNTWTLSTRNPDTRLNPDPDQHQGCLREPVMERQLEKERIREEIIAAEVLRRRILEAEVRRELMLELDHRDIIAVQRRTTATATAGHAFHGFDQDHHRFGASSSMRFDQARLHQHYYPFDDNGSSSALFASRMPPASLFDAFSSPPLPLPQPVPPPPASSALDLNNNNNKDKLILLAKPDPNLSGVKRKTLPTVGASELPPFGLKKKPKEEWSCALCQVSATSEKGIIQHINGKKHKAKEAGLRAQKLGKSSSNAPLSKKTEKASERKVINGIASSGLEAKDIREPLDHNETRDGLDKKIQDTGTSQGEKEGLLMQKDQCGEPLKIKADAEMVQGLERTEAVNKKKKYKFWCGRCKVGAHSPKVMSAHMSGKKHIARGQELKQNNVPIASSMAAGIFSCSAYLAASASSATLLASDVAKETHEKIPTATAPASSGDNEKA